MVHSLIRILVGIALLYAAWCCYWRSVALIDDASGHIPTKQEAPDGDLDFFSQPNPIKDPPTPFQLQKVREAQWAQRLGLLCGCPGIFLVLLGMTPSCLRLLAWLFIPDSVRQRHSGPPAGGDPESAAPDSMTPDSLPTTQEEPCDTAAQS